MRDINTNSRWDNFYSENSDNLSFTGLPIGLEKILFYKNSGNLIELGCGDGRNLLFFREKGNFNLSGVDYSEIALNKLKKFMYKSNSNQRINLEKANILDYSFIKKYDILISSFVLHLFNENSQKKIITNMMNNTKINGINYIASLNGEFLPNEFISKPSLNKILNVYSKDENFEILDFNDEKTKLKRNLKERQNYFYLIAKRIK